MNAPTIEAAHRYTFTDADFAICDQFQALLERVCVGPVKNASASYLTESARPFPSAGAQDKYRAYCGDYEPRNIGKQLVDALDRLYAENPSEEERKARRIAEMRAELASLTGEQVAE